MLLAVEQLPSILYVSSRRELSVALVRRLDVGATDGNVIKNVIDLLFRKIGPIGHSLLLELREQSRGGGIARLNDGGGSVNELQQPVALTSIRYTFQIGPYFDSLAVRMARGATLVESCSGIRREFQGTILWLVISASSLHRPCHNQESKKKRSREIFDRTKNRQFHGYRASFPKSLIAAPRLPILQGFGQRYSWQRKKAWRYELSRPNSLPVPDAPGGKNRGLHFSYTLFQCTLQVSFSSAKSTCLEGLPNPTIPANTLLTNNIQHHGNRYTSK